MCRKFQDVYDEYHRKMHGYLGKIIGEGEAEDLTQEVFVKINKALPRFGGQSKLSTWIYRIATNAALDRLGSASYRQKKREFSVSRHDSESDIEFTDQEAGSSQQRASPAEKVVKAEMDECILEFVDRLPPD